VVKKQVVNTAVNDSAPRFDKVKLEENWKTASDSVKAEFANNMAFHGFDADTCLTKWLELQSKSE
jgi:hypothetical protein